MIVPEYKEECVEEEVENAQHDRCPQVQQHSHWLREQYHWNGIPKSGFWQ
jgi:hypothetical protein